MDLPQHPYSDGTRAFEKKLKQHHRARNRALNLAWLLTLIGVLGVALIVALSPTMSLYSVARALFAHR